jgi:hypothetical protein
MGGPGERVKTLFDQALAIAAPAERAAFRDRECAAAPEVRRQVEALLRVHADMDNHFLQKHLLGQANVAKQSPQDEDEGRIPDVKVRALLDQAARNIEGNFPDQPLIEAATRSGPGRTWTRHPTTRAVRASVGWRTPSRPGSSPPMRS